MNMLQIVTDDATPAAGAAPACRNNTRKVFQVLMLINPATEAEWTAGQEYTLQEGTANISTTDAGLALLTDALSRCTPLDTIFIIQLGA